MFPISSMNFRQPYTPINFGQADTLPDQSAVIGTSDQPDQTMAQTTIQNNDLNNTPANIYGQSLIQNQQNQLDTAAYYSASSVTPDVAYSYTMPTPAYPCPNPNPTTPDTSSGGGTTPTSMTASYEVGFVSNLIERLYKDPNHSITAAENQAALTTDGKVAQVAKAAQTDATVTANADALAAAVATQKLYDKKTNFDKTFTTVFGTAAVNINSVRAKFGQNVDAQLLGGQRFEDMVLAKKIMTASGDTQGVKDLDMYVHVQGSHEGDLVNADGTRVGKVSLLPNVDATDTAVETKDQAKARSDAATAAAPANNPTGTLVSQQAFQNELNKEQQGMVDQNFINSEITGHKAKGDFIQNYMVNKLGISAVKSAADANLAISSNATQFLADYNKIGSGGTFINRTDGAATLVGVAKAEAANLNNNTSNGSNDSSPNDVPNPYPGPNPYPNPNGPSPRLNNTIFQLGIGILQLLLGLNRQRGVQGDTTNPNTPYTQPQADNNPMMKLFYLMLQMFAGRST
jgi:hypothetical protein